MKTFIQETVTKGDIVVNKIRPIPSLNYIADQWNTNVECRAKELDDASDETYFKVIIPNIKSLLHEKVSIGGSVLDLGCGLGHLTALINSWGYKAEGIDIADKAIEYAKHNFSEINFQTKSIIDFAKYHSCQYDACVLNMVLHNLEDIGNNLKAVHKILKPKGIVIASIPHPETWFPKHFQTELFEYKSYNKFYELPFKIRGGNKHPSPFIYFHRPVEYYSNFIISSNFKILYSKYPRLDENQSEEDLLICVWQKE